MGGTHDWTAHRIYRTTGGDLVRLDRVGPAPEPPAVEQVPQDEPTDAVDGAVLGFQERSVRLLEPLAIAPVRVRLEDAVTGEVRWETLLTADVLPAGTEVGESSGCLWTDDDGDLGFADEGGASDIVDARTLSTTSCGIDAVLDVRSGEVVTRHDSFAGGYPRGGAMSFALTDGLYAELEQGGPPEQSSLTMHVTRDDGSVVGDVPGYALPLLATDGPSSALILAMAADGDGIAAYDADDARLRWRNTTVGAARPIVRTASVVVATDGSTVAGLDRATGKTLWTHDLYETQGDEGAGWWGAVDAVTDGERVVVTVPASQTYYSEPAAGGTLTVALDLATGDLVWRTEGTAATPQPIGGRLYRVDGDAVVGLE